VTDESDDIQVPLITDGDGVEPPGPNKPAPEISKHSLLLGGGSGCRMGAR